jgi:hypothetical protein
MEGVEHRQVTFARHAEDMTHAVPDQLVDQDLGSGADIPDGAHEQTHDRSDNSKSSVFCHAVVPFCDARNCKINSCLTIRTRMVW